MSIVSINKDNFESEVLNETKTVLVDFNADWCGPCRMLKPVLDELSNERDDYKFVSVNIDDEEELSDKYQVSSIPCLVVLKDGKEIKRSVGFKTKDELNIFLGDK